MNEIEITQKEVQQYLKDFPIDEQSLLEYIEANKINPDETERKEIEEQFAKEEILFNKKREAMKEQKLSPEQIKEWIFSYMLYQEEMNNPIDEENLPRIREIVSQDETFSKYAKEDIFIEALSKAFYKQPETITHEEIKDRITYFDEAKSFFEKPFYYEILLNYGRIISPNIYGNYSIDEDLVNDLLKEEGFSMSSYEMKEYLPIIEKMWNNKKELITNESLELYSKRKNGISFKYFLFCEEYLKRGKITSTCEALGIGRTTAHTYLKNKEVKEYLEMRKEEIRRESDTLMKQGFFECFDQLQKIITKESYVQDHDRIKAIDTYLRHYEQTIKPIPERED